MTRGWKYSAVIYQCALKRDLNLFDAGDQTEVGEKGITLRYADLVPYHDACAQPFVKRWAKGEITVIKTHISMADLNRRALLWLARCTAMPTPCYLTT